MSTLTIFAFRHANARFYRSRSWPGQSPAATFLWHRHLACESTGWKPVPHKTAGTPMYIGGRYVHRLEAGATRRPVPH